MASNAHFSHITFVHKSTVLDILSSHGFIRERSVNEQVSSHWKVRHETRCSSTTEAMGSSPLFPLQIYHHNMLMFLHSSLINLHCGILFNELQLDVCCQAHELQQSNNEMCSFLLTRIISQSRTKLVELDIVYIVRYWCKGGLYVINDCTRRPL